MFNFSRLASDKGIPFVESGHHHAHEGWGQTHCPFCADGTYGYHLGFNLATGYFSCWRCGGKSTWKVLRTLFPHENVNKLLEEYSDGQRQRNKAQTKTRSRSAKKPLKMRKGLYKEHKKYLTDRNFNPEKLESEWELSSTKSLSGEWRWRIITPLKNMESEIVGYTGRAIGLLTKPKWKTSSNEELTDDPKKLIYGIEKINDRVLIVEGPSDVWRMGPGTVGLLGIDWSVEQAHILRRIPHRYIMFDSEPVAQARARQLARWLSPFPGDTEIITGIKKDPGSISDECAYNIMRDLSF